MFTFLIKETERIGLWVSNLDSRLSRGLRGGLRGRCGGWIRRQDTQARTHGGQISVRRCTKQILTAEIEIDNQV